MNARERVSIDNAKQHLEKSESILMEVVELERFLLEATNTDLPRFAEARWLRDVSDQEKHRPHTARLTSKFDLLSVIKAHLLTTCHQKLLLSAFSDYRGISCNNLAGHTLSSAPLSTVTSNRLTF